ncbi:LPS assembly protein LptD [Pseudoalteromonas aurantia]|uniref:LPS-assembly protein LptD n=4 Tax=Pseudoalteromonas TaxID=53246 RepID=A0A5S3VCF5_9GAMM|nr:LPS assembly protein LptD [Pseudoalteromonas aurantia]TMO60951.1 LPS-assembly protein LptD [Pseudoalteromonas aurantia]TMO69235.1 LPS-assembly protein LptD [Pseudoalteromonas aurantia]TMO70797.1 LPS-assembly protein LptD [Pseudoalteromonas aurantia]
MRKTWGVALLVLSSAPALATSEYTPMQCSQYFQPKNWLPLSSLPKNAIDIQADDVEMQGTASAEFSGNVDINTTKMRLSASSALIDKERGLLNATGPLTYQDAFTVVKSSGLYADLNNNDISLLGADYQLTQQVGRGGAEKLYASEKEISLYNSSFTTCPVEAPFWQLEASTITFSKQDGWGESYNAVLKVLDTPIIYIPYFTFPIDDRRKSGLLAPVLSSSSSKYGFGMALPFYWNIAPNYDATITPRYMSKKGLQLISEFRYLTAQHQGLIGVEYLNKDDAEPTLDSRYLVHWQQQSYFNEQWRLSIDVTNVSDDAYLTDLDSKYGNQTETQLNRTGILSYLGDDWLTDIKLQNFEVLGAHTESYAALPQISWRNRTPYQWQNLSFSFLGDLSHFRNDNLVITEASRLHIEPSVRFSVEDYAWSFLAETSLLHTHYEQDGDFSNTSYEKSVSRTMPKVRMHTQLNFERKTKLFNNAGIQTLEPQIQYLYAPKRDQNNIGLYDTTRLQDDFAGLFREQRFSGVDRIAQANQFTLGATTRVFDNDSTERFNFSIGQIIYLSDDVKPSAQAYNVETNYNALFAAETMVHWHRRWYFSAGMQYDADSKDLIQSHTTLNYRGDNNKLVQLNHRYANSVSGYEIDQIGIFSSLPINQNWQFVARYHRDLNASRSVEVFAGIQYDSCCWAIQITGGRHIETDLNQTISHDNAQFDTSIGFNFVFKGLGDKSNNGANQLLQQGIFGYRRPYFLNN